ncbi:MULTISPECIES: hypothetical protein [unclassified Streptomyces]|uniref:phthiocerol/phthiodiolone dimycocerosyl transferase family protein n=1 Tax=unclassified Streptomyces TaxID=2593676 RepID=UPI00368F387B
MTVTAPQGAGSGVAAPAARRLSDIEASFAWTHALMRGTTQVTTHVTVRGDLDPARLGEAVRRWAAALPILSLRIDERPDGLWFRPEPGAPPPPVRTGVPDPGTSPDDVLREELNDVLDTGGPLWRLRLVRDPRGGSAHLYFTRNHAISDGHSTGAVLRSLLDLLYGRGEGPGSPYDVGRPAPNADELPCPPPAAGTGTRPDGPEVPAAGGPAPLPFADHRPWDERGTDMVPLAFTAEESLAVRAWCKEHGTTVNQFFAVALAASFAQVTGRTEISLYTAVSLRRRYAPPTPLPDVGCFISVLPVPLRLDGDDPVRQARAYATALARADAAWRPPRRDHAEIRRAVGNLAAARSSPGICLTNVGVVDPALGPHAGRVTGFRTVVNRTGANYGTVLHLGTLHGAFTATLAFGTPSTDPATVRGVAKALRDRVRHPGRAAP